VTSRKHHNVYVVELDRAVLEEPRFAEANPRHDQSKACYYVGLTGLTPEERFKNHREGRKSNKFVRKYGLRLCEQLYSEYNPLSYEDGVQMEAELARMLRARGHAVWQR
jgi:hypothetical protein